MPFIKRGLNHDLFDLILIQSRAKKPVISWRRRNFFATIDGISGSQSVLNSRDKNAIHVNIEVLYVRSRSYAE